MKKNQPVQLTISTVLLSIVILLAVLGGSLTGYRLVTGKSLGLRNKMGVIKSKAKVIAYSQQIRGQGGSFNNVIFLHHSVGNGIIVEGHLRELLQEKGFEFWDQGYIAEGLRDPEGRSLGFSYDIPGDNTDPDGLSTLFSQTAYALPVNGLSQLMQHDIILMKSCYPTSDIRDEAKYQQFQNYYLGMRNTFDRHPDKLFVLLTQPPLNPAATDAGTAKRARTLANWLKSDAYLAGHPNVAVFDLFDVLAEGDATKVDVNMLRAAYRTGADSHPNANGSESAARLLADFIEGKATAYQTETD